MIEIMFGSLFAMLSSPHIMGLMLIGVFIGLIVGVTPGIGGRLSIALAIPFVFGMDMTSGAVFRRGEIVGSIASRSSWEWFVKNGYGRFIAQIGGSESDLPQLASQITDPTGQTLIALVQSQGDIARLTAGPPGIPKEQLKALRDAYRKALEDKELLEKAWKLGLPIEPLYGDDVLMKVKVALDQSPQTIALLKEALKVEKK
jgi:hypothetical protein